MIVDVIFHDSGLSLHIAGVSDEVAKVTHDSLFVVGIVGVVVDLQPVQDVHSLFVVAVFDELFDAEHLVFDEVIY